MLTKTLKVTDRFVEIPGIESYIGKLVEITVKVKKEAGKKRRYKKFFSLCGKINIDEERVDSLRNQSMI